MTDPNYVSPADWAEWTADTRAANLAYAKTERERKTREQPQLIEALMERVEDLEVRVYALEQALTAACEVIEGRKRPVLKVAA